MLLGVKASRRISDEINYAAYDMLLRVPGIGYKSASRIVKARRMGMLDFEDLKKMGVVLKRALYFITCKGKMMYPIRMDEDYITRNLLNTKEKTARRRRWDELSSVVVI